MTVTRWLFGAGIAIFYFAIIFTLCVILSVSTVGLDRNGVTVGMLVVVSSIAIGSYAAWLIHKRWLRPFIVRFQLRKEIQCHEKFWRPEFVDFLQRSQFDYFEARELLYHSDISGLKTAMSAIRFYQRDYALAIFSRAQRCVV